MIPYSTKVKIKPTYKESIIITNRKVTNIGEVVETGANVFNCKKNDIVIYAPDPNVFHEEHYWVDAEYVFAILNNGIKPIAHNKN